MMLQIPFSAYAEDCTVHGEIALGADRLADLLASTTEYEVRGASFRALDDGRVVEADSASILRDDLCLVVATGPRGRPDRRLWTRQHPVRARVGPYVVLGYLHAPPTVDPMRSNAAKSCFALTDRHLLMKWRRPARKAGEQLLRDQYSLRQRATPMPARRKSPSREDRHTP